MEASWPIIMANIRSAACVTQQSQIGPFRQTMYALDPTEVGPLTEGRQNGFQL